MDDETSITDRKAAFIRTQVRLLSAPVRPSSTWQDPGHNFEEGPGALSDKTVQEIIAKVNNKIKAHNRLVFSSQSQRHVAEQIDALYWNEITAEDRRAASDATWIRQDADLCEAKSITLLPEDYADLFSGADQVPSPQDGDRYQILRQKLVELNHHREEQSQRLETYRSLQHLLRPFENAQENVQPNLVTKDGELSKELDRTRMLIARVMSKTEDLQQKSTTSGNGNALSNDEKLSLVLGLP